MGAYSGGMFRDGQVIDAIYVQSRPYGTSSGSLAVYIPMLETQLTQPSNLQSKPMYIDSSCFSNTSECKPAVAKRVETREWVIAKAPNFPYKCSLISYGAKLKVKAIVNKSGLDFKLVSEELDPSWDPIIE